MNRAVDLKRIVLQYIGGLIFSYGFSILYSGVFELICYLLGDHYQPSRFFRYIKFGPMFFVCLPVGAILGISLFDNLIFKASPRYKLATVFGLLSSPLILAIVFIITPHRMPLPILWLWMPIPRIPGISAWLFVYPLVIVLFALIGYNLDVYLKFESKFCARVSDAKEASNLSTENTPQPGSIRKKSELAILSLICGCCTIPSFGLFLHYEYHQALVGSESLIFALFPALAIALALFALLLIPFRRKTLKGAGYAILAIMLSIVPLHSVWASWDKAKYYLERPTAHDGFIKLQRLSTALFKYAKDNEGILPNADKWCDLLKAHDPSLTNDDFRRPFAHWRGLDWDCHFAFNKNLSEMKMSEIPDDVVLLFEANGDWNLNGTEELLKNRLSDGGFAYVLYKAGYIESWIYLDNTVTKAYPGGPGPEQLRWNP
jgi:hypothetical protein